MKVALFFPLFSVLALSSCGDPVHVTQKGMPGADEAQMAADLSQSMNLSDGIQLDNAPFVGGQNGYKVYRAPTMVTTQKSTILAFAEGRVNGHADEDDMDVVLRRSEDGGKTWQKLQVLVNDGKNPCKNQSPVVLPNGRILLVYLWNPWIPSESERGTISRKVYSIYSDDDGMTWSNGDPKNRGTEITGMVQRPEWGWTGLGPVHGIVKQFEPNKGRILLPSRHNPGKGSMLSHVFYSDDSGKTWKIGGSVNRPKTTESTIVELSDGRLLLGSRNQVDTENHRVMSLSTDGGLSFPTTWLETQLIEPRGVQASLFYYGMNSKTGKGNILFSNPNHKEIRSNGTLRLSTDDGKTWSESVVYAPKKSPYFTGYSDIVKLKNGDIGVLYERGNYDEKTKGERYEEIGFAIVKKDAFPSLRSSAPPAPPSGLDKEERTCLIEGGEGKELFKDKVDKQKCESKCSDFKNSNKNLTCQFHGSPFLSKKDEEDKKKADEAAAAKKKADEDKKKADEAAAKKKAEEDKKKADEAAAKKKAEDDKKKADEAAAKKKAEDDKKKADEAAAKKKAEEDKKKADEASAKKKAEEDKKKADEAAAAKKKAEDDARKKAEEDKKKKKK